MALNLTVYFNDGYKKSFTCEGDEDATMRRHEFLEVGYEEKDGETHIFYPAHAITKIAVTQE